MSAGRAIGVTRWRQLISSSAGIGFRFLLARESRGIPLAQPPAVDSRLHGNDDGRIGCHSEERNDEESQATLDPFGYILAAGILSMHIEPENPVWV